MVEVLTRLFNKILNIEKFSSDWNILNIIILLTKGDRHKVENYQPITLVHKLLKTFQNRE